MREITLRSLPVYSCTSTMWSALIISFTEAAGPGARCRASCNQVTIGLSHLNKGRTDKRGGTEVIHAINTGNDWTFDICMTILDAITQIPDIDYLYIPTNANSIPLILPMHAIPPRARRLLPRTLKKTVFMQASVP